jgi:hypothetical protein
VEDGVAAAHRPLQAGAVEEIDVLVADVGAALTEYADDVPADEAQPAAGDVDANGPRLRDSGVPLHSCGARGAVAQLVRALHS